MTIKERKVMSQYSL